MMIIKNETFTIGTKGQFQTLTRYTFSYVFDVPIDDIYSSDNKFIFEDLKKECIKELEKNCDFLKIKK